MTNPRATRSRVNGVSQNDRNATDRPSRSTDRRNRGTSNGNSFDADQIEDTVYEVEKVVGKRYDQDGKSFYYLKWRDYEGEPTWEPKENCQCEALIDQYEAIIARRERGHSHREEPSPGPSGLSSRNASRRNNSRI